MTIEIKKNDLYNDTSILHADLIIPFIMKNM